MQYTIKTHGSESSGLEKQPTSADYKVHTIGYCTCFVQVQMDWRFIHIASIKWPGIYAVTMWRVTDTR